MPRRDPNTPDMFEDYQPPEIVDRFDSDRIRSVSFRVRVAKALSETMKECDLSRAEIAAAMSLHLDVEVTENMLNAYASEARSEHRITFERLVALIIVTNDRRLLQLAAEEIGCDVIEHRWLKWVEVGQLADRKAELDRVYDLTRRSARLGTPR